jgi:hypothetical protein
VHTDLNSEEIRELEATAAVMATKLLEREDVTSVHLYCVPRYAGESIYTPYEYRLLVIVDKDRFAEYEERLLDPPPVVRLDGDDDGNIWNDESPETPREAVFHALGMTEESFFGYINAELQNSFEVDAQHTIDVILMPSTWMEKTASQLETTYTGTDDIVHPGLLPEREGHYALTNYRVFDPATNTFVSPR